ncbi:MAG: hypothetical protein ABJE10_21115, partial [bacterium]
MTPAQFAIAVGADSKWIQNTRRLLARKRDNSAREARWLGVVHDIHANLGCPLAEAARIANLVIVSPPAQQVLRVKVGEVGRAELVIDLWRDWSIHLARLSLALTRPPSERRGRPVKSQPVKSATRRAVEYGVDVSRLQSGLHRTVAERLATLDQNTTFLAAARASVAARRNAR